MFLDKLIAMGVLPVIQFIGCMVSTALMMNNIFSLSNVIWQVTNDNLLDVIELVLLVIATLYSAMSRIQVPIPLSIGGDIPLNFTVRYVCTVYSILSNVSLEYGEIYASIMYFCKIYMIVLTIVDVAAYLYFVVPRHEIYAAYKSLINLTVERSLYDPVLISRTFLLIGLTIAWAFVFGKKSRFEQMIDDGTLIRSSSIIDFDYHSSDLVIAMLLAMYIVIEMYMENPRYSVFVAAGMSLRLLSRYHQLGSDRSILDFTYMLSAFLVGVSLHYIGKTLVNIDLSVLANVLFKAGCVLGIIALYFMYFSMVMEWLDYKFEPSGTITDISDTIYSVAYEVGNATEKTLTIAQSINPCSSNTDDQKEERERDMLESYQSILTNKVENITAEGKLGCICVEECRAGIGVISKECPYGLRINSDGWKFYTFVEPDVVKNSCDVDGDRYKCSSEFDYMEVYTHYVDPDCVSVRADLQETAKNITDAYEIEKNQEFKNFNYSDFEDLKTYREKLNSCFDTACTVFTVVMIALAAAAVAASFWPGAGNAVKLAETAARVTKKIVDIGLHFFKKLPKFVKKVKSIKDFARRIASLAQASAKKQTAGYQVMVIYAPMLVGTAVGATLLIYPHASSFTGEEKYTRQFNFVMTVVAPVVLSQSVFLAMIYFFPTLLVTLTNQLPETFLSVQVQVLPGYVALQLAFICSIASLGLMGLAVLLYNVNDTAVYITRTYKYFTEWHYRRYTDDSNVAVFLEPMIISLPAIYLMLRNWFTKSTYVDVYYTVNARVAQSQEEIFNSVTSMSENENIGDMFKDLACGIIGKLVAEVIGAIVEAVTSTLTAALDKIPEVLAEAQVFIDELQKLTTLGIIPVEVPSLGIWTYFVIFGLPLISIIILYSVGIYYILTDNRNQSTWNTVGVVLFYLAVTNIFLNVTLSTILISTFSVELPFIRVIVEMGSWYYNTQIASFFIALSGACIYINAIVPPDKTIKYGNNNPNI